MSETAEESKLPYPVRHGAVPTPDGVFPVDITAGGQRRKRRPMFDLEGELARHKVCHQNDLLETAWGIIANAHGGNWEAASDDWREAAEKWRDRYFADGKAIEAPAAPADPTANLQLPGNPDSLSESALAASADVARQGDAFIAPKVEPMTPKDVFVAERWLSEQTSFDNFVAGLAGFSDDRAAEILGHHWNREEDSFLAAVQAKWNEFQIAQTSKNPPVIPPVLKDPARNDLDDDAEDAPVNSQTLARVPTMQEAIDIIVDTPPPTTLPVGSSTSTVVIPPPPKTARKKAEPKTQPTP